MKGEVVFLTHTAQPGGAELALRRYLERTALDYRLLTLEDGATWRGLGARVEVRPAASSLHALTTVRGYLRERQPRVVVANTMRAALYAALARPSSVDLVYWVRDGLEQSAMSPLALALTRRVTLPRTRLALANSEWTAGTVGRTLPGLEVLVAHSLCGVDAHEVRARTPRTLLPGTPLRLLSLGRLAPWKAPHLAVESCERLNARGVPTTLTIAGEAMFGEGAYRSRLQARVEASPLRERIVLAGHVDDVTALLDRHDVLVHCSVRPEPFGQVLVQAMAQGLPAVATSAGGPREILPPGTGDLYPPGDVERLTARLVELSEEEAYALASATALTRALAFDDAAAVQRVDRLLGTLTETGGSPRTSST
jgi:glycosyltransferase involved in cell wall biosynthesis